MAQQHGMTTEAMLDECTGRMSILTSIKAEPGTVERLQALWQTMPNWQWKALTTLPHEITKQELEYDTLTYDLRDKWGDLTRSDFVVCRNISTYLRHDHWKSNRFLE